MSPCLFKSVNRSQFEFDISQEVSEAFLSDFLEGNDFGAAGAADEWFPGFSSDDEDSDDEFQDSEEEDYDGEEFHLAPYRVTSTMAMMFGGLTNENLLTDFNDPNGYVVTELPGLVPFHPASNHVAHIATLHRSLPTSGALYLASHRAIRQNLRLPLETAAVGYARSINLRTILHQVDLSSDGVAASYPQYDYSHLLTNIPALPTSYLFGRTNNMAGPLSVRAHDEYNWTYSYVPALIHLLLARHFTIGSVCFNRFPVRVEVFTEDKYVVSYVTPENVITDSRVVGATHVRCRRERMPIIRSEEDPLEMQVLGLNLYLDHNFWKKHYELACLFSKAYLLPVSNGVSPYVKIDIGVAGRVMLGCFLFTNACYSLPNEAVADLLSVYFEGKIYVYPDDLGAATYRNSVLGAMPPYDYPYQAGLERLRYSPVWYCDE